MNLRQRRELSVLLGGKPIQVSPTTPHATKRRVWASALLAVARSLFKRKA